MNRDLLIAVHATGKSTWKERSWTTKNIMVRNLRTWFGMSTTDLFRMVVQKVKIACMIPNIRNRQELSEEEDDPSTVSGLVSMP